MHDAGGVRGGQRVGDLSHDTRRLRHRERTARQSGGERLAFVVGHRDERLAIRVADLVDRADVRVIERAGRARFAHQPGRCCR